MPRTQYDQGLAYIKQGLALLKASEPPPAPQARRPAPAPDEWAATVARMRELRESGKSYLDVAIQLDAEGHRGRYGGRIFGATVRATLMRKPNAKTKPIEIPPDPIGDILRQRCFHVPGAKIDFRDFRGELISRGCLLSPQKIKARLIQLGVLVGTGTGNRRYLGNLSFDQAATPGKPYRLTDDGKLRQC